MTPNKLVLIFGGLHVCVQFGENRRRSATVRVSTDGQTHARTDAKRFYYLSHAICYSYKANKNYFRYYTRVDNRVMNCECFMYNSYQTAFFHTIITGDSTIESNSNRFRKMFCTPAINYFTKRLGMQKSPPQ